MTSCNKKNGRMRLRLIYMLCFIGLIFSFIFINSSFARSLNQLEAVNKEQTKKTSIRQFRGHVDWIGKNKIVIDDRSIPITPGVASGLKVGDEVNIIVDKKAGILRIVPVRHDGKFPNSKSSNIKRNKTNNREKSKALSKEHGIWKNY